MIRAKSNWLMNIISAYNNTKFDESRDRIFWEGNRVCLAYGNVL